MRLFLKGWLRTRFLFLFFLSLLLLILYTFAYIFPINVAILHYQLSLIFLLGLIFLSLDWAREYKKYLLILAGQKSEITGLSESENVLISRVQEKEAKYQDLQALERVRHEEVLDYFTLWAHQIKIPLTASDLLIKELENSQIKHQLTQEHFRIAQYADLAMNYLRLENFHDDLVLKEEDAYDLVKEVVKKYAMFFIHGGIKLDLEPFHYRFVTDKKWLAIVLEQLLSNSIKYTRAGTIRIFMKADYLFIADTGIGIQAGDLNRVFERGFSGFNGRINQQSSGLGLYLSKTIANQLGHELSLSSQVGVGTEVAIHLKQKRYHQD